ncbi:6545_t:CDS:1, partial [Funneliformis mosseae]
DDTVDHYSTNSTSIRASILKVMPTSAAATVIIARSTITTSNN